jgi:hypothetical protein
MMKVEEGICTALYILDKIGPYGVDWIYMASCGSSVGRLECCVAVTVPVAGVEPFVVTVESYKCLS